MPDSAVEKKLASLQTWVIAGLIAMLLLAAATLGLAVWASTSGNSAALEAQRKSDEALACYVLPQLDRAEASLPGIAYYREHKDELRVQIGIIRDQRRRAIAAWGLCPTYDNT